MHVKLHRSGPRTYLRIVEGCRDAGKVKHRTFATLGRLSEVGSEQVDSLINGLLRVTGRAELDRQAVEISALPALELGPWGLLTELWRSLGLDKALSGALRSSRRALNAEHLARVMVFNRLCDPESKLGLPRWLEGVRTFRQRRSSSSTRGSDLFVDAGQVASSYAPCEGEGAI